MDKESANQLLEIVKKECAERGLKVNVVSVDGRKQFDRMLEFVGGERILYKSYVAGEKPEIEVKIIGDKELAADMLVMLQTRSREVKHKTGKELKWELDYKSQAPDEEVRACRCGCPLARNK